MHKLRLLLLVGLMFAVGGTLVARSQDGTEVFSKDKKSDSKHEKTKNKTNDGHRKHWYSPPHWFHRKHDNSGSAKVKNSDTKTVAAKNQPVANRDSKTVAATTSTNKSATATHPGTKSVATSGQHKKTVAGARRRKPVKTPCTPEQARKTGCHLDKGSNQKGAAAASPGKSS